MKGAVVDAIDHVMQHARNILPNWVDIERIPTCFDWQKDLLDEHHLLVRVLLASDRNCSHAVSIQGGSVCDANEVERFHCVKTHLILAHLQQKS